MMGRSLRWGFRAFFLENLAFAILLDPLLRHGHEWSAAFWLMLFLTLASIVAIPLMIVGEVLSLRKIEQERRSLRFDLVLFGSWLLLLVALILTLPRAFF